MAYRSTAEFVAALEAARLRVDALGRGALPEAEAALRVAQAAYRFGGAGQRSAKAAGRGGDRRADHLDAADAGGAAGAVSVV